MFLKNWELAGVAAITEASKNKYAKPSLRSAMPHNARAFCCADIPCFVSRQLKPIEKLMLKVKTKAELYSVSRIWADSERVRVSILLLLFLHPPF